MPQTTRVTTKKRLKIIANPISGMGRASRLAPFVVYELERRGYHIDFYETKKSGDARSFANHVLGYDRVVFIGGDGTLSEVINGLPDEGAPPLGAIPAGTGNAYAKELQLPMRRYEAEAKLAEIIDTGRVVTWDLGQCTTHNHRFLMFAGAGYHTEVIRHFHINRKGATFIGMYLYWGWYVARNFPLPSITVEVDGKVVARESTWVEVFNISHYGGPLRLAPHANPSDGEFDVMIFHGRRFWDILRLLYAGIASYSLRRPWELHDVTFVKGRHVRLTAEGQQVPIHMDGDFHGYLPAEFSILPGRVKLLAPRI